MATILMIYLLISYFLVMFTIIMSNRMGFVEMLEEDGYYEFSSFHKIVYITAVIGISMVIVIPIYIKVLFLDS